MKKKENKKDGTFKYPFYAKKQSCSAFYAYSSYKISKPKQYSFSQSMASHKRQQSATIKSSFKNNVQNQEEKRKNKISGGFKLFQNTSIGRDIVNSKISFQLPEQQNSSAPHTPINKISKANKNIYKNSIHEESYSFSEDLDFNLEESDADDNQIVQPIKFFELAFNKKHKSPFVNINGKPEDVIEENIARDPDCKTNKLVQNSALEGKPEIPNITIIGALHSAKKPSFIIQTGFERLPKNFEEGSLTDRTGRYGISRKYEVPSTEKNKTYRDSMHRTRNTKNYNSQYGTGNKKEKIETSIKVSPYKRNVFNVAC